MKTVISDLPTLPPIIKGIGYKYGDWILTLRDRFYVINPAEGTFIKYKSERDFPLKPTEIISLKDM